MSELVFDRHVALLRAGGDEELLKEIAVIFLEDYPKVLAEIRSALADGDGVRLEQSAHALKGSAANFGADAVVEAASRLEQLGRAGRVRVNGQGASSAQEFERLEQALSALRIELEAL